MRWSSAFSFPQGPGARIVCAFRDRVADSLTPTSARFGLDGPRPAPITPVGAGRCRPTPDRVPLGASPDRDARRIMTGGLTFLAGGGFLPVLGTPPGGVGRVHGDDRDRGGVGHRGQPSTQPGRGHPGDESAEPFPTAVPLPGLGVGEVQILHRDRLHTTALRPAQQPRQGMAHLGVTMSSRAGQVVVEPARVTEGVAVHIQTPGGQVVSVHIDTDHPSARAARRGTCDSAAICHEAVTYQRPRSTSRRTR